MNALLQSKIKIQHEKDFSLRLDYRTCWNNIKIMLERFLMVYNSVSVTLADLNLKNYCVDDILPQLTQLSDVLKPITLAVEALERRDTTLVTSEGILKFLFLEKGNLNNPLALELYGSIPVRISERRKKDLV